MKRRKNPLLRLFLGTANRMFARFEALSSLKKGVVLTTVGMPGTALSFVFIPIMMLVTIPAAGIGIQKIYASLTRHGQSGPSPR